MLEKINEFLDNKGINDEFIRNIVIFFINSHTDLYGDVVSFESLMERLNTNLHSISLIDPSQQVSDPRYKYTVGCYEGFNKNSISMFFTLEDLKNPRLREDFISILIHELTHCAYTIKQNDVYKREKQMFGTYEELLDGKTPLVNGNDIYMEPIINYISTRVFGKENGIYPAQTINIIRLTSMLDEKEIIRSAFNSDEEAFRQTFEVLPEGAYEYFTEGMEWLSKTGEYGFRKANEIMTNFYSGNIPSLSERQKKIKELKSLKSSLSQFQPLSQKSQFQPLSQEQRLEEGYSRTLKRKGFINMFLLILILGIVISIVFTISLILIK